MRSVTLAVLAVIVISGLAIAEVWDFDCAPYTPGVYVHGYPVYTTASKWYDADGNSADLPDTWTGFGFTFRPAYYGMLNNHRWTLTASVPYMSIDPGVGTSQSGIGDMSAAFAYWVWDNYKKWNNLSFWMWADIPTGNDEKGLGTGQMNIRPGLAYCYDRFPYQIQTSAYYNLRMKNSDTETKPGDEIWANASFGYGPQPNWMIWAEVRTGWGQDTKVNDVTVPDSKQTWFKVGPSFQYNFTPAFWFKVTGLYNVMGKNSAQSIDLGARLSWCFTR